MRSRLSILAPLALGLAQAAVGSEKPLPEDIASGIDETRQRDTRTLDAWAGARTEIEESLGLDWTASYHSIALGSFLGQGAVTGASGDFTVQGIWAPGKHWRENPTQLRFRLRHRHAYAGRAVSEIGPDIGALWGVVDGFSDSGFEIPDFYLRHVFEKPQLEIRYGQMTIDSQFGGHQLASAKKSFLNQAFASNPAVAFPRFGAGLTVEKRFDSGLSLGLGATTVQGTRNGNQVDFNFGSSDLFHVLQAAYDFEGNDGLPQRIQLLGWHSDAIDDAVQPEGEGLSLTYEREIDGDGTRFFSRLAWSEGGAAPLDYFLAAGCARPFGDDDFGGVAAGIGRGATSGHPTQAVIEAFYRWQPTEHFQISPDLQLVFGNDLNGGPGVRIVTGLRAAISF